MAARAEGGPPLTSSQRLRTHRMLWAVTILIALSTFVLAFPLDLQEATDAFFLVLFAGSLGTIGLLVARRQPGNAISWVLSGVGFFYAIAVFGGSYGEFRSGSLPGATGLDAIAEVIWVPSAGLTVTLLLLLFPDGQPPSPRWRWAAWAASLGLLLLVLPVTLVAWLQRAQLAGGLDPALPWWAAAPAIGGALAVAVAAFASLAGLIVRFRRSKGSERQQLKWFVFGGTLAFLGLLGAQLPRSIPESIVQLAALAVPAAIAIAILRYRLYDIDLVINRTMVYGSLTTLLALVYVAGVVGLPRFLPLAEDNDLVVGGSTLAVAALFSPLRRRVQGFVDRRLYRRRYDSRKTVEAFAGRLRNEMDLDELRIDLLGVVQETFQPARLSVWLKETGRAGG
ncbi:MAG: hypothetical protein ACRDWX_03130 [Acidimicrobiia bacterium]